MKRICRVFVVMLCVSVLASGQGTNTGNFTGIVKDVTGGVLLNAVIAATHTGTGIARTVTTNDQGIYSIRGLQAGIYDVKAEYAGFTTQVKKEITLAVGATLTLDFSLGVSTTAQSIEVSGVAPLIETTQSQVAGSIQTKELENLPILNRNFAGLVILMPGIRPAASWDPTKRTIGGLSIGGSNGRNVNTTIDGGDSKDNVVGGMLQNFTTEGIQEFRVAMHRFSAAEGRSSGASLTIVTKSGTNELHGSAFLFARDAVFQAKDFFARRDNLLKPPLSRQQFGGSFGGPIIKDRAFYFGAVERIRENISLTVPNNLYDEMQLLAPFGAKPAHQVPKDYRETMYTIKGDFRISDHDSVIVRWAQQRNNAINDQVTSPNRDLSVPTFDVNKLYSIVASETKTIGATKVNQFTFQANDFLNLIDSDVKPPPTGNLNFPSVSIGRTMSIMQTTAQRKLQFRNDFSAQIGRHALRLGGDYAKFLKYGGAFNFSLFGSFTFFDDPSVIMSNKARYPQGFATPGAANSFTQATAPGDFRFYGAHQTSMYFQDDWRMNRRLTLNLGLRYDVSINFYDLDELPNNRTYKVLKAIGSPYGSRLPRTDMTNVAPRFGFAFDPRGNGNIVIRGGYGLFFDESFINPIYPAVAQSKPQLNINVTRTNTAPGRGELATFRFGIDPAPTPPPAAIELPPGGRAAGRLIDPDYRNPYTQQMSIGVGYRFGSSFVLDANYSHVLGLHEFRAYAINTLNQGVRRLAPLLGSVLGDPNLLGQITIAQATNRSRYDELAVKLEKRGQKVSFQASYTLSRAYGYGGRAADNGAQAQDQDNLFAPSEWAPTNNDERHRVVLLGVFQVPVLRIQISPVMQVASSRPYNLTAGTDLNGDGINNDRYVDPATGKAVAVNSARGNMFFLTDMRVTKFFQLRRERIQLSLFGEFFNLFNHTNFGNNFNGNGRSSLFRQPVGFMGGIGTGAPFQAQFGARLSF